MTAETILERAAEVKRREIDLGRLCSQATARRLLTWSLSLTFFWFGALKFAGVSPVVGLLQNSFSFFAEQPYLGLLGLFEMLMAFGLLVTRFRKLTIAVLILHLLGTLSVVFINPQLLFSPYFPVLSMDGEFIVKNLVLISACLVLLGGADADKA